MRNTFVRVLDKIAEKDERVICVIGDTGFSVFEEFEKNTRIDSLISVLRSRILSASAPSCRYGNEAFYL